ncbi:MAG TPA: tetratricopeptide repeat protein [Terriglobia bacterium]|nr:tetratricopeptide repeat protein [Terriglobia bacterium]
MSAVVCAEAIAKMILRTIKRGLMNISLALTLLLLPFTSSYSNSDNRCVICHPQEAKGFSRSAMARSLRSAGKEPEGTFEHAYSGTKFTIYSNQQGLWQRMERDGDISEYRVAYVVGSGNHASGYLVRIGDHLFQSPLAFYSRLKRYDMAPGYEENRAPDFIRAVSEECLLCHSGKPLLIKGTLNEYPSPAFAQESISCDRCHGNPAQHLKAPLPGSIVNPAKLPPSARNSICEQCHLKGVARVLNPGKRFEDFHPGVPLEQIYTTYVNALPTGRPREALKVISHSEQLALSLCARKSNGRMWCGTCHNPHDQAQQPPQYYRARCLSCHQGKLALAKSHPGGSSGDCVGCHMFKLNAKDGGHTVFTDHRISRSPEPVQDEELPQDNELVAWREPAPALRERNLALAYVDAGLENGSASEIAKGYPMLTEVEKKFPNDPLVLAALGKALLNLNRPLDAANLFERVLNLGPDSVTAEWDAGRAWMNAGQIDKAIDHLERAVKKDPLFLPAAESLVQIYREQGDKDKLSALGDRVRQALGNSAPQEASPPDH